MLDPEVRHGVLENGMEYFIKKNPQPKKRASFYLVQKVGAILEEDHQNGLAHMLEHLAFNGSQNFPNKEMQGFLERHGAEFGKSMNAYTALDETVYNISNVPISEKVLDSCVLILHDWSGKLTLSPEEIDAERNVVQEEWRTRNNANFRMDKIVSNLRYNNSKFARRDVIGDMNIIINFEHESLLDFYRKWYRPNLQAIVIVGDFNVDEMEQRVRKIASSLENPKQSPERTVYTIEDNKELLYGVATDIEAKNVSFEYAMKHPATSNAEKNEGYVFQQMKMNIIQQLLARRFKEELQIQGTTFTQAQAGYYPFLGGKDIFVVAGVLKEQGMHDGIKDVIAVVEKAKQTGFTPNELNLVMINFLKGYEYRNSIKEDINNDSHAEGLIASFLSNEPYLDTARMLELAEKFASTISLDEINKGLNSWFNHENAWFTIKGPKKESITYPTEKEVSTIIATVRSQTYEVSKEDTSAKTLLSEVPKSGEILAINSFEGFDKAKSIKLSNGATVWMFPTENSQNDVHYSAISKGGISLLEEQEIPSAKYLVSTVLQSGLGIHKQNQLLDILAGKALQIQPELGNYTEGFAGGSSQQDLETLLQLQYLYFTEPRFDQESFDVFKERIVSRLQSQEGNPGVVFNDSLSSVMSNYSKRRPLNSKELLETQVKLEDIESIYKERFGNISDFTFIFVGSVNDSLLLPLVRKYIGSIEGNSTKEQWKNDMVRLLRKISKSISSTQCL